MDNRLDFFNVLNEYSGTLTDDDSLLVLSHNKKTGDCITLLNGDWETLSMLLTVKGYVNFKDGSEKQFKNIKAAIMNMAVNICASDNEAKEKFKSFLNIPLKCNCEKCTGIKPLEHYYED